MFLGKKKPCVAVESIFSFGVLRCGSLTNRRLKVDDVWVPACKKHIHSKRVLDSHKNSLGAYSREVGSKDALYYEETNPYCDRYEPVADSSCFFGCKIYINVVTGERVLVHSSSHGCDESESL